MHVKQSLLGFDIGQALQGHPNTLQGFVLHNGDRHFVGLINIGKQLVVEILFFWLLLWKLAIDFHGITLPPHFLWRLLLQFAPSNSNFEILTWLIEELPTLLPYLFEAFFQLVVFHEFEEVLWHGLNLKLVFYHLVKTSVCHLNGAVLGDDEHRRLSIEHLHELLLAFGVC